MRCFGATPDDGLPPLGDVRRAVAVEHFNGQAAEQEADAAPQALRRGCQDQVMQCVAYPYTGG